MHTIQPLLSVIIPCYNCAPVITRCLDSIDCPECEIIVVNDGSTDDSRKVVEKYITTHSHVALYNKDNGGVSSARNLGIEKAKGVYLSFIDADDYVVPGGLERIVQLAIQHNADVVKFRNISISENSVQDRASIHHVPINIEIMSGHDVLSRYDISDYIVWDGIYRRSAIIDNNLRFMTDLSLHEDDTFMGMLYCHVDKMIDTDLPLYRYVMASNFSSTHRQPIDKQRKLIMSGLLAIRYRKQYVLQYYPDIMPIERLKYMRWVCNMRQAIQAQMTYYEYMALLNEFCKEGVYPLDYAWIKAAGFDYSRKIYLKRTIQSFMVNHPFIGWSLTKCVCYLRSI